MIIKIEKQKLDETKKILEACKQECQKLFYEHDALKNIYCELEQTLKIQKALRRKRKNYIDSDSDKIMKKKVKQKKIIKKSKATHQQLKKNNSWKKTNKQKKQKN